MSVIALDFYEPDDTLIGTLDDTQLIECELRPAFQELGAISFTVSRHLAEASAALLAKGNLVKVRIPVVDADPIALFVLKDDVFQLLSKDEQGGEHLTVTGPGGLHMLSYSRLREEVYAPGQPTRGDWDDDVSWNWRGRAYGAILARVMEEGQGQPGTPLSEITLDFDRIVDSDGVPWAVIAEDFTVPIGIDVLTLANRLATAGDLYLVLTPDLVLHAYQTYGRDLTGAFAADNVRFEKGVNILTELQRKTRQSRVTHLITRDMDQVYRTFITPDSFDQAVYGFLGTAFTNDPTQIEKVALEAMKASDEGSESYIFEALPGGSPEGGEYLPGPEGTDGHFWPGDVVTIHTGIGEHDLNAQSVILSAVSIVLDIAADDLTDERAARSLRIVPEVSFGVPLPVFAGGSDVDCSCSRPARPIQNTPASCSITDDLLTSIVVENGGGEDGVNTNTHYWGPQPFSFETVAGIGPHSGTYFVRFLSVGDAHYEFKGITFTAGVTYVLKFWMKSISGQYLISFGQDPAGDATELFPVPGLGQAWGRYCIEWTPSATYTSGIHLGIGGTGGAVTVDVDDIQLFTGGTTPGEGDPALIGTSFYYQRADDTEHYHTDRDPTTTDKAPQFRANTLWINEDTGALFLLIDAAIGDWLAVGGGVTTAGALTTRYEPHVDYTGSVVLNGIGDPVMVEVAN